MNHLVLVPTRAALGLKDAAWVGTFCFDKRANGKAPRRPIALPCAELAREERGGAGTSSPIVGSRCHRAAGAAEPQGSRDPAGWCKRTSACDLGTGNGSGIG